MHRSINGSARPVEDPNHGERLVIVSGEVGRGQPMRDYDFITDVVAEITRNVCSQNCFVDTLEAIAGVERQRLVTPVPIKVEIIRRCPHDSKSPMGITERDRNRPSDFVAVCYRLVRLPTHVVGGVANAKHAVEQKVRRRAPCPDDEIRLRDRVEKAGSCFFANLVNTKQQRCTDSDRDHREHNAGAAEASALQRN